jgi:hypothetical protein
MSSVDKCSQVATCSGSSSLDEATKVMDACNSNRGNQNNQVQQAKNSAAVSAATAAFPMLAPFAGIITGVLNFITSAG